MKIPNFSLTRTFRSNMNLPMRSKSGQRCGNLVARRQSVPVCWAGKASVAWRGIGPQHARLGLWRWRGEARRTQEANGLSHLRYIAPARGALREVPSDAQTGKQRQGLLQVAGYQLAHITADRHAVSPVLDRAVVRRAAADNVTRLTHSCMLAAITWTTTRMRSAEFDDPAFLAALRAGDPGAYRRLIRRFHNSLVSVADAIIGSRAQAEEVVQDAWLAVFSGVGRFEGRSSFATWLFSIVLNRARTRASREARLVGLPTILDGARGEERAADVSEFKPDGHWIEIPRLWDELSPERVVGGKQLWAHVQEAITRLPAGQRAVVILRDMEERDAEEACALLGISAENQRVLLHRARGRIRKVIDSLLADPAPSTQGATVAKPHHGSGAVVARLLVWARRLARMIEESLVLAP